MPVIAGEVVPVIGAVVVAPVVGVVVLEAVAVVVVAGGVEVADGLEHELRIRAVTITRLMANSVGLLFIFLSLLNVDHLSPVDGSFVLTLTFSFTPLNSALAISSDDQDFEFETCCRFAFMRGAALL
ncbi:MAG: hypothetical protein Q8O43_04380 [Dehalococcoidia bacterium]|nr:hypothetical protein [Dehalococcoidia bacterium]